MLMCVITVVFDVLVDVFDVCNEWHHAIGYADNRHIGFLYYTGSVI